MKILSELSDAEFESELIRLGSQGAIAKAYQSSQMTVSRRKQKLGLTFDGKAGANRSSEKRRQHSNLMKQKYQSGFQAPWKGKEWSPERRKQQSEALSGRPAWNSGKRQIARTICENCAQTFEHAQHRSRKYCSRSCTSAAGAYNTAGTGQNNPNFGNGTAIQRAWKDGKFADRPLPKHNLGRRQQHNGIWFRSSYEVRYAIILEEAGIQYEYEQKRFQLKDGRSYTPDFFLPCLGEFREVKGWWEPRAKAKFECFLDEYPHIKIAVIQEEQLKCKVI